MAFHSRPAVRTRMPALVLLILSPFWAVACTGSTDGADSGSTETAATKPVAATQAVELQGTIEATVDGERITWYSVSGQSGGAPYSSSTWMPFSDSERIVAIGGFATDDPPIESFEWSDAGMPESYGTYEGSVFALAIDLSGDRTDFSVTFPDPDGRNHLSYQPRATLENVMANTLMMSSGTLSVTDIAISGDLARASGTFSGTFRSMEGDQSVEITDGVFDVEGIPNVDAISR